MMTDIPENVTLEWLARQILEIGEEVRAIRQEIQDKILPLRSLRDDANLRRASSRRTTAEALNEARSSDTAPASLLA
jgi:hypothetical protein